MLAEMKHGLAATAPHAAPAAAAALSVLPVLLIRAGHCLGAVTINLRVVSEMLSSVLAQALMNCSPLSIWVTRENLKFPSSVNKPPLICLHQFLVLSGTGLRVHVCA